MALPFRHDLGRAVKPLLDRKHFAAGPPLLPPPIPAKPDKLRRSLHGIHDGVELLQAVGMRVRKPRQIAAGEGRLLSRDGVERDGRVGDDPIAVLAGDVAMLFEPIRL